jgi:hypothetical protein
MGIDSSVDGPQSSGMPAPARAATVSLWCTSECAAVSNWASLSMMAYASKMLIRRQLGADRSVIDDGFHQLYTRTPT